MNASYPPNANEEESWFHWAVRKVDQVGSPIRGNDGVDTYRRDDGYYVEHFSIAHDSDNAIVRHQFGPFADPKIAAEVERAYRWRWGNNP